MILNRKTIGKPWENGDLYGKSQFLMGKLTISTRPFSMSQTVILSEGTWSKQFWYVMLCLVEMSQTNYSHWSWYIFFSEWL